MHAPDRRYLDGEVVAMDQDKAMFDPHTGNVIRKTDNSLKECDLPGASDIPAVLDLQNGIPVGWTVPRNGE